MLIGASVAVFRPLILTLMMLTVLSGAQFHSWIYSTTGPCDSACASIGGTCNAAVLNQINSDAIMAFVSANTVGRGCTSMANGNVADEPYVLYYDGYWTDCAWNSVQTSTCSAFQYGNYGVETYGRVCCCSLNAADCPLTPCDSNCEMSACDFNSGNCAACNAGYKLVNNICSACDALLMNTSLL